jgi:hypothetical protein
LTKPTSLQVTPESLANFTAALKQYAVASKKTLPEILNQKAYWIALRAIKNTYKVDKDTISAELNQQSRISQRLTIAEALVIRATPDKHFTVNQLERASKKLVNKRRRAVGSLRVGLISAINTLAPFAEKRSLRTKISVARPKGYAIPARDDSWKPSATVVNSMQAGGDVKARGYMESALDNAMIAEAASMMAYVEKKMKPHTDKFNKG